MIHSEDYALRSTLFLGIEFPKQTKRTKFPSIPERYLFFLIDKKFRIEKKKKERGA